MTNKTTSEMMNLIQSIKETQEKLAEANAHIDRLKHDFDCLLKCYETDSELSIKDQLSFRRSMDSLPKQSLALHDAEVIEDMLLDFETSPVAIWRRDHAVTYWAEKSIEEYAQQLRKDGG